MQDQWIGKRGVGPWASRNVMFFNRRYPGVVVKHCCHPTANYPWYTCSRDGELRTFGTLAQAKAYVEEEYA
jgi:hypothetical protein